MAMKRTSTDRTRLAPDSHSEVRNNILAALLATEYKQLLPKLERVRLECGDVIYRADQQIENVYFPEEAVVAMVDSLDDARTVEVGIIGCEGIVGINIFLGGLVTPDKAIVQLPGGAMSMQSKELRKELRVGSPLQQLLLGYARTFLAVISQSVACCQHHSIEQRLARWLLTMNHYSGSGEFLMAHHSIAAMLGVRREGITEAASSLQAAGLIRYRRGRITVVEAAGLGQRSCECYRFIGQQYKRLHAGLPQLLYRK